MSDAGRDADPIRAEMKGKVLELSLARPPRNVIDRAMLVELTGALASPPRGARAILLRADGPSFSVGAAVPEHARAHVASMLAAFHGAVRALIGAKLPIVASVRGHCLGGGLELVLCATKVFASPEAQLGQPEIKLGAFAPVASLLLARRIGGARAESMLLTGEVVTAGAARDLGLIDAIVDDPDDAARAWLAERVLPHSASSLRIATAAARATVLRDLDELLPHLEDLYVYELAHTHDAEEGVRAFLEKRAPHWEDR